MLSCKHTIDKDDYMFKNILLIILLLLNAVLGIQLHIKGTIDYLSIHVLIAGISFIITTLLAITHPLKLTKYIISAAFLFIIFHIYEIVMIIYHYVYT